MWDILVSAIFQQHPLQLCRPERIRWVFRLDTAYRCLDSTQGLFPHFSYLAHPLLPLNLYSYIPMKSTYSLILAGLLPLLACKPPIQSVKQGEAPAYKTVQELKPADAATLTWYDFEAGYQKAVKDKKILLVDAYTDWCGWCKVMDKNTYSDQGIIAKLNADFVAVKFNPEKTRTYKFGNYTMTSDELLAWLGRGRSYGYPTSYFWLDPGAGENLLVSVGYEDPARFGATLDTVLKRKGN